MQWLLILAEQWSPSESFKKFRCQGPVLETHWFILFTLLGDFNEQPGLRVNGLALYYHFTKEDHIVYS